MVPLGLYSGILSVRALSLLIGRVALFLSFPWKVNSSKKLIKRAELGDMEAFEELIRLDLDGRKGMFSVAADSWHYINPSPGSERTKFVAFPSSAFVRKYEDVIGQTERAVKEKADQCACDPEKRTVFEGRLKQLDRLHRDVRKFRCQAIFSNP